MGAVTDLRAAAKEVVAEWDGAIADGGLVTIALGDPIATLRAALEGDSRIRESGRTAARMPADLAPVTNTEPYPEELIWPARESTPDEPRPGTRCRCRHGCEATYGPGAQGWGRGLCGYCNERHDVKNDMAHGDPIEVRSCLVCGQPTETFAVWHGGYPFIGACFRCRDAGNRAKDDASRAALATPAIEPGIDPERLATALHKTYGFTFPRGRAVDWASDARFVAEEYRRATPAVRERPE